ncbi:MAG: hypothetical protein ACRD7E_13615 [Bryobacteraceae bacterium]
MSEFEDHFGDDEWINFVRQLAPPLRLAEMQRHLDNGCEQCRIVWGIWSRVRDTAVRETGYEAPEDAVRSIKAAFAVRKRLPLFSRLAELASLVFDSWREPLPVGIRGGTACARHVLHETDKFLIDLRLEQEDESHCSLVGQVLPKEANEGAVAGTAVALAQGEAPMTQTIANSMGEFQLEFDYRGDLRLYLQVPGAATVVVALPSPGESPALI